MKTNALTEEAAPAGDVWPLVRVLGGRVRGAIAPVWGAETSHQLRQGIRGAIGNLFRRSPAEASRPLRSMGAAVNRSVEFSDRQLRRKFNKHATDFGVTGNNNSGNIERFREAMTAHVADPATLVIPGSYRRDQVTHFVNPNTGLNVMRGPNRNFISGYRLNPAQLRNVLERGSL